MADGEEGREKGMMQCRSEMERDATPPNLTSRRQTSRAQPAMGEAASMKKLLWSVTEDWEGAREMREYNAK